MRSLLNYIKEDVFDIDKKPQLDVDDEVGFQTIITSRKGKKIEVTGENYEDHLDFSNIQYATLIGINDIRSEYFLLNSMCLSNDGGLNEMDFNFMKLKSFKFIWDLSGPNEVPVNKCTIKNLNLNMEMQINIGDVNKLKSLKIEDCNMTCRDYIIISSQKPTFKNTVFATKYLHIYNFLPIKDLFKIFPTHNNPNIDNSFYEKWGMDFNKCQFIDFELKTKKGDVVIRLRKSPNKKLFPANTNIPRWDKLGKSDWWYIAETGGKHQDLLSANELQEYFK